MQTKKDTRRSLTGGWDGKGRRHASRAQVSNLARRVSYPVLALVLLLVLWYALTIQFGAFVPTPIEVMSDTITLIFSQESYLHILSTLRRIVIAFTGSMLIALAMATVMNRDKLAELWFAPWNALALSIPGPVYIIFAMLILGVGEASTVAALVVAVSPFVTSILLEGFRNTDRGLMNMARSYNISERHVLRHVLLPDISPALLAGARTSFALSWKLVVVLEALSANEGIGNRVLYYFRFFDTSQVVAWTFLFAGIMQIVEMAVFTPVERRVFRWRERGHARTATGVG